MSEKHDGASRSIVDNLALAVQVTPVDLLATVLYCPLTAVVVLSRTVPTPVRTVIGLPFLFFLPGYALVSALFPGRYQSRRHRTAGLPRFAGARHEGVTGGERAALAFGASLALLPILGLVLSVAPWGLGVRPVLATVGGFVVSVSVVAAFRRLRLPPAHRFQLPLDRWVAGSRAATVGTESAVESAVNMVLALAVVLALVTFGYALTAPADGSQYTGFELVSRTDAGEYVAGGYPTDLTAGETTQLTAGIENHEGHAATYTVVVQIQRVDVDGEQVAVLESERLGQFTDRVPAGETSYLQTAVTPTMTGDRLRLTYLLYEGNDVPDRPSTENAYRHAYVWVNVSRAG